MTAALGPVASKQTAAQTAAAPVSSAAFQRAGQRDARKSCPFRGTARQATD